MPGQSPFNQGSGQGMKSQVSGQAVLFFSLEGALSRRSKEKLFSRLSGSNARCHIKKGERPVAGHV